MKSKSLIHLAVTGLLAAGLAAGAAVDLWLPGYIADGETAVVVDAASVIEEVDEENNTFFARLPIPTPPPPCRFCTV